MEDPGFSKVKGTYIQQNQLTGNLNQQWKLNRQPNGNYKIVNAYSNQVLDDPNSYETANGIAVEQYTPDGGINQQWELAGAGSAPVSTNYIDNAYSGKVVDDTGFSVQNGTGMQQYQLTGGYNQRLDGRATVRRLRRDRQPV